MLHPGDPFGKVLAWLWRSGRSQHATVFVADYLSEMRNHSPHAPEPGARLTWDDLKFGIAQAIRTPYDLSETRVDELCAHLESAVPGFCGAPLVKLRHP